MAKVLRSDLEHFILVDVDASFCIVGVEKVKLLVHPVKPIPLHTSLPLKLAHVPDAGNEVHDSLHA
jgi:hypothetical protein